MALYKYKCQNCDYSFTAFVGESLKTRKVQETAREKMRAGKWGEHWQELIEKYPKATVRIRYELFHCEHCQQYFSAPVLRFYVSKAENITPHYLDECDFDIENPVYVPDDLLSEYYQLLEKETISCPDCGDSVETVYPFFEELQCPKCSSKPMKEVAVGHEVPGGIYWTTETGEDRYCSI